MFAGDVCIQVHFGCISQPPFLWRGLCSLCQIISYLLFRPLRGFLLELSCAVAMVTSLAGTGLGVGGPTVLRGPQRGGGWERGRGRDAAFSGRRRDSAAIHGPVNTCATELGSLQDWKGHFSHYLITDRDCDKCNTDCKYTNCKKARLNFKVNTWGTSSEQLYLVYSHTWGLP